MKIIASFALICHLAVSIPTHLEDNDFAFVEPDHLDKLLKEKNYDEFNRLMGIDIPHLSRPRSANATGDPRFSIHLYQGDILLTPAQKEQARQGINFTKNNGNKWKSNYVPYAVDNSLSQRSKDVITNAVKQFNSDAGGCIKWGRRRREDDYVYFFSGNGCFSNLGRTGGRQTLSLAENGCMYMGTALHEMDHAIGFIHEQCRPDRDDYIRVLWNNINKDWKSQYEKDSAEDIAIQGSYDYYSIMHYPQRHPDVSNNKKAFDVLDSTIDVDKIGNGDAFTEIDKQKIKKLYCGK